MKHKWKTLQKKRVSPQLDFAFLKKAEVQLAIAGLTGLLLVVLCFVWLYIPQQAEAIRTGEELEAANRRVEQLSKIPVPVKVKDADVEALLRQVPVRENMAGILTYLQDISESAGVKLNYVNFSEAPADKQAKLENLITKASEIQQSQPTSGVTIQPQATPAQAGQAQTAAAELASLSFLVEVSGTYGETMNFLHQMQQSGRILQIMDWALSQTSATAASAQPSAAASGAASPTPHITPSPSTNPVLAPVPVVLKCNVRTFIATAYQNELKEPPAPQVSPGTHRTDPTWTDKMLYELLDQEE